MLIAPGPDRLRSHRRFAVLVALLALAPLALVVSGCNLTRTAEGDQPEWSTKDTNVFARPEEMAALEMPEPFDALDGPRLREVSIDLLLQAADSDSALLRANAIEALENAPELLEQVLAHALKDENRGVRFVATMTVGRTERVELMPLVEPLVNDPAPSVRAAAIYATRRCGHRADPSPLATMVMSVDPEVRANAAYVLGELKDPSAIPMLRAALQRPMPGVDAARERIVELQIAEAIVKLGGTDELDVVRAALFSPIEQGEIVVLACQTLGRLRDRAYMGALVDKAIRAGDEREPAEVRLAAIEALAQIEPSIVMNATEGTIPPIRVVDEYITSDRDTIRAQAAATLGWTRSPSVLATLAGLLDDRSPIVQVAAAGSVLRIGAR